MTHKLEQDPRGWHCTSCEFTFTTRDVAEANPCIPAWIVALRRARLVQGGCVGV